MKNVRKTVEGFKHWTENEENGVCYIPADLCSDVLELLKNSKRVTHCKDCRFFGVQDWWSGGQWPVLMANQVPTCFKWGNGCKTDPNGYCHFGKKK